MRLEDPAWNQGRGGFPARTWRKGQGQGICSAARNWTRVARTFSLGLANVLAIAAPDRIAVGGGVAKMGDELFSRIRRYTEEYAFVADARTLWDCGKQAYG